MNKLKAFTMIELLVTIAVVAVLAAITTPSLRNMALNNRLTGFANDFVSSVSIAKSEAVSNRRQVQVSAIDGDWDNGWKIVVDTNGDGDFTDTDDELIKTLPISDQLTFKGTPANMVVNANGMVNGLNWGGATVCDSRGKGRTVNVVGAGITSIDKNPTCN